MPTSPHSAAPTQSRVAWLCRYISGASSDALPVPARASPSATTFLEDTRVRLLAGASADLRADAAQANRLLAQGTSEIARHALATVASCAHGAIGEVRQAEELALLAIQADPRAVAWPDAPSGSSSAS